MNNTKPCRKRVSGVLKYTLLFTVVCSVNGGVVTGNDDEIPVADATFMRELHEAWRWSKFTMESGLPANRVYDVVETGDGIAWAATDRGVAWFDEYQWHPVGKAEGLPALRPRSIQSFGDSRLLVHIAGEGIFVGDGSGFERIPLPTDCDVHLVRTVIPGPDGVIWVLTLREVDTLLAWENGVWRTLKSPPDDISVKGGALIRYGEVAPWLSTSLGLYQWLEGDWVRRFEPPSGYGQLYGLTVDDSGHTLGLKRRLGMATEIWERKSGESYQRILSVTDPQMNIMTTSGFGETFVVSTNGRALVRRNGEWNEVLPLPREFRSTLFVRHAANGDLWVGAKDGLYLHRRGSGHWTYWAEDGGHEWNKVIEICSTRDGATWIGTREGVEIHRADGSVERIEWINETRVHTVTGIAEDGEGHIWVTSGSAFPGAFRWNGRTWEHFGPDEGLDALFVHKVRIDRDGRPWFLGLGDIQPVGYAGPGAFVYEDGRFTRWGEDEGLINGRTYGFDQTSDGAYWFATAGGISRWHEGQWRHWDERAGLVGGRVFTMAIDSQDRVWFGDQSHGLGCIEENGDVRYITTSDGLPSNRVWDIRVDHNDRLWVATGDGLACSDGEGWSTFTSSNGLINPLIMCVLPGSDRVLAGTDGSGTAVLDLAWDAHGHGPRLSLREPMVDRNGYVFEWEVFSYLGAQDPDEITTRYRIDDEPWSAWSINHTANVAGLEYGDHEFEVESRGLCGFLEMTSSARSFRYARPLHRRPVVYVPLVLAFLGLVTVTGFQIQRRRQTGRALRATEARFQALAEHASTYVYASSVDPDGTTRLEWASAGFSEIYGCSVEQYNTIGGWRTWGHPDDQSAAEERFVCMLSGEPTEAEKRIVRPDGEVRWVRVANKPEIDAATGRVVRVMGAVRDITERKQAEEALNESEHRYRRISELVTHFQYASRVEPDGCGAIEWMTGDIEELFGRSQDEVFTMDEERNVIHPDDLPAYDARRDRLLRGESGVCEIRLIRPDGSIRWVETHVQPEWDEAEQRTVRVYGAWIDITQRKETEAALRESEATLRSFVENVANIVVYRVDLDENDLMDSRIAFCSPSVREVLGLTDWQDIKQWFANLHPDDHDHIVAATHRLTKTGETYDETMRFYHHGKKEWRWIHGLSTPVRNTEGRVTHVHSLALDVTDRVQAEEALRDSEERLQGILDHSPSVIFLKDTEGRYLLINHRYEELFHISNDEIRGKTDHDVFPQEIADTLRENDQKILTAGTPLMIDEDVPHDDGEHSYMSLKFPVRNSEGEIMAVCGIATDITDRKKAEEALKLHSETQTLLLRELDHRVRNNLSSLISLISISREGAESIDDLASAMRSRTQAIASVYSFLSKSQWRGGDLKGMMVLLAQSPRKTRISIEGPETLIPLNQAQALGLIINELTTNSVKYGAMSVDGASVRITWTTQSNEENETELAIHWGESDGPVIEVKPKPGTGMGLITGLARSELRGKAEITYPKEGAAHTLHITLTEDATAQFHEPLVAGGLMGNVNNM